MRDTPHGAAVKTHARPTIYLRLTSTAEMIRETLADVQGWMIARGLTPILRAEAELVLAEVLNNIAEHAYSDRAGPVTVRLRHCGKGIYCLITDHGGAMPGDTLPDGRRPECSPAHEDLPEGGFGWHVIRLLARDLRYGRKGGYNRLGFFLDGQSWQR